MSKAQQTAEAANTSASTSSAPKLPWTRSRIKVGILDTFRRINEKKLSPIEQLAHDLVLLKTILTDKRDGLFDAIKTQFVQGQAMHATEEKRKNHYGKIALLNAIIKQLDLLERTEIGPGRLAHIKKIKDILAGVEHTTCEVIFVKSPNDVMQYKAVFEATLGMQTMRHTSQEHFMVMRAHYDQTKQKPGNVLLLKSRDNNPIIQYSRDSLCADEELTPISGQTKSTPSEAGAPGTGGTSTPMAGKSRDEDKAPPEAAKKQPDYILVTSIRPNALADSMEFYGQKEVRVTTTGPQVTITSRTAKYDELRQFHTERNREGTTKGNCDTAKHLAHLDHQLDRYAAEIEQVMQTAAQHRV